MTSTRATVARYAVAAGLVTALLAPYAEASGPYRDEVLYDRPWGYWRLEQTAYTQLAVDESANGRHFQYLASDPSTLSVGIPGRFGGAAHFRSDGGVRRDDDTPPDLLDFSVELWLKTGASHSRSANAYLFYLGQLGSPTASWRLYGGRLQISYPRDFPDAGWRTFGPEIDNGLWHHVVVTRDTVSQMVRVYVDGVEVSSVVRMDWGASSTYWGSNLDFGPWPSGAGVDLTLDEPALYTHVLSPGRVAAHHSAPAVADSEPPRFTSVQHRNLPAGWVRRATPSVTLAAEDDSSGIRRFELVTEGVVGPKAEAQCIIDHCPRNFSAEIAYDTDRFGEGGPMREGVVPIRARAVDGVGRTAETADWTIKLDRSGPAIRLSGPLKQAENTTIYESEEQLLVDATDGSSASPGTHRSGVASIDVLVDGERTHTALNGSCSAGNCPLSTSWTMDAAQFANGQHTIEVVARDFVGNETRTSFRLYTAPWNDSRPVAAEETDGGDAAPGTYGDPELVDYCRSSSSYDSNYCGEDDGSNSTITEAETEPPLNASGPGGSGQAVSAVVPMKGYGLSDQNAGTFDDNRFKALGIKRVRLVAWWNVVTRARGARPGSPAVDNLALIDAWMKAVKRNRLDPLVSFSTARGNQCPDTRCYAPTVSQYAEAVQAFRDRYKANSDPAQDVYPTAKWFTAWNEPNHPTQATYTKPELAGQYWNKLRAICSRSCSVAAGDFSDRFFNRDGPYFKRYKHGAVTRPHLWAYHPYTAGTTRNSERFREFFSSTAPKRIWLTELGGIVKQPNKPPRTLEDANQQLDYLLRLANLDVFSPRITRFYVYHWRADPRNAWDSGLLSAEGPCRPSYFTYRAWTNPTNGESC